MCGITAISANKEALPFLLQGLEKLEYRGYDSAGITTIEGNHLFTKKAKGRLQNLKETECYDVEKYTYSLLHQTRQLEYF